MANNLTAASAAQARRIRALEILGNAPALAGKAFGADNHSPGNYREALATAARMIRTATLLLEPRSPGFGVSM